MLRTGLYYSLNTVKQLVAGGCDKATQEITDHVPEQSWGQESGSAQALWDQRCFKGANIFFLGAFFENTWDKYGWGCNDMFNKGFLAFL